MGTPSSALRRRRCLAHLTFRAILTQTSEKLIGSFVSIVLALLLHE